MRLFKSGLGRPGAAGALPGRRPDREQDVTSAIANAQGQVESQNFRVRKNVLRHDDVMDRQRKVIYAERREVLEGSDLPGADPGLHRRHGREHRPGATETSPRWDLDGALDGAAPDLAASAAQHRAGRPAESTDEATS